ncbi:MAG: DUF1080 domain-containing protein [Phycisphaerae bacterium]|nr:DUF1080 domain-containing protein [Phycisphaerae bacterium]
MRKLTFLIYCLISIALVGCPQESPKEDSAVNDPPANNNAPVKPSAEAIDADLETETQPEAEKTETKPVEPEAVAIFNGQDLSGWLGFAGDPYQVAAMTPEELATAQTKADEEMNKHWSVQDGLLFFDGKGHSIYTNKEYKDFILYVDWKIQANGDSGIYLKGFPQVQIWDPAQWPEGSGGLYNNKKGPAKPLVCADNPIGQWNTFKIEMVDNVVTVHLNDKLVVDKQPLENYFKRGEPIPETGRIELQCHGHPLYFKNIKVIELN